MQPIKSFLAITFLFFTLSLQSQSLASADKAVSNFDGTHFANESDWAFYLDAESKVYYIDFETISVNLNDVQVKNEKGDIVMADNLWDLPVNTIYELDFGRFEPGKYQVELRTYTGRITKEVTISE